MVLFSKQTNMLTLVKSGSITGTECPAEKKSFQKMSMEDF